MSLRLTSAASRGARARRHREDEVAGGWAKVAGPGAGHVCGGDDWGDAAEFSLRGCDT